MSESAIFLRILLSYFVLMYTGTFLTQPLIFTGQQYHDAKLGDNQWSHYLQVSSIKSINIYLQEIPSAKKGTICNICLTIIREKIYINK